MGPEIGPKKYLMKRKKPIMNNAESIIPTVLKRAKKGTISGKITYTHHSVLNDHEGVFNGAVPYKPRECIKSKEGPALYGFIMSAKNG
jgi:hypothetical protein